MHIHLKKRKVEEYFRKGLLFRYLVPFFLLITMILSGCGGETAEKPLTRSQLKAEWDAAMAKPKESYEDIARMNMLGDYYLRKYPLPTRKQLEEELPVYVAAHGQEVKRDAHGKVLPGQYGVRPSGNKAQQSSSQGSTEVEKNAERAMSALVNGDIEQARQYIKVDMNLSRGFETTVSDVHAGYSQMCLEMKIRGLLPSDDTRQLRVVSLGTKPINDGRKIVHLTIAGDRTSIPVVMINENGMWKMSIKSYFEAGAALTR